MKKRFITRRLPNGWYVIDKERDQGIEWYGLDRNAASVAACYWNFRQGYTDGQYHHDEPHPYPNRFK